jgi:hypothetical protein
MPAAVIGRQRTSTPRGPAVTLDQMGPLCVIVTGFRHFTNYARLRDTLDRLLANRRPDVVFLSRCGRGTDALARRG